MSTASSSLTQSVERSLRILALLGENPIGLGVTEISRLLKINKSTVYRLLFTLETHKFVEQNPDSEAYRLGLKIFELGSRVMHTLELREVAIPYLKTLAAKSNETAHLVVRDGYDVVYLAKEEPIHPIRMVSRLGSTAPLHCTAVGKAILAALSNRDIKQLYGKYTGWRKYTRNSIKCLHDLVKELDLIRNQGYAVDREEFNPGVCCVGAAIHDCTNNVVGAISLSGPKFRFTNRRIKELTKMVITASEQISRRLGYLASYPEKGE
ncbi:MAG: IclR family transcriptional regulator [bacterium]|nr:IclR family transcriptional regulator [bacterium]